MNEINHIHLGRQPFTIAVDAHKQLREYLDAIGEAVGESRKEVLEEVELRMAELLTEHGVTSDKTILAADITFLQEQLGKPGDFKTDDEPEPADKTTDTPKRLYRDEKNGIIAGVCAGLAAYFHVDTVIVRIIFVIMTLFWGWGILVYVILWLITPPARTGSERLRMRGKAVTVENLKSIVDRADLPAAAARANKAAGSFVETLAKGALWMLGIIFMIAAICGLFGLGAVGAYALFNWGDIVSPAYPVATSDVVLAVCMSLAAALIFIFMALIGVAMTRRTWPVAGWITAALIGILLTALAVGAGMAPKVIDKIGEHCGDNRCEFRDID